MTTRSEISREQTAENIRVVNHYFVALLAITIVAMLGQAIRTQLFQFSLDFQQLWIGRYTGDPKREDFWIILVLTLLVICHFGRIRMYLTDADNYAQNKPVSPAIELIQSIATHRLQKLEYAMKTTVRAVVWLMAGIIIATSLIQTISHWPFGCKMSLMACLNWSLGLYCLAMLIWGVIEGMERKNKFVPLLIALLMFAAFGQPTGIGWLVNSYCCLLIGTRLKPLLARQIKVGNPP